MTLYRPDQVTEAISTYIETLIPLPEYATWTGAAWRRATVPAHLQKEAGAKAPLAFSIFDLVFTADGVELTDQIIRYRAQVTISFLFDQIAGDPNVGWQCAVLAQHHLLSHLLLRTSAAPPGIAVIPDRGIRLARTPEGDMILCDLSLTVSFDAPLSWS